MTFILFLKKNPSYNQQMMFILLDGRVSFVFWGRDWCCSLAMSEDAGLPALCVISKRRSVVAPLSGTPKRSLDGYIVALCGILIW